MFTRNRTIMIDGWSLRVDDDHSDDDVTKLTHTAYHLDGTERTLDVSPYKEISDAEFLAQVKAGFPRRSEQRSAA